MKNAIILLIMLLFLPYIVLAQNQTVDLQKLFDITVSLDKANTADIDGDGDLDFVRSRSNPSLITVHRLDLGSNPSFVTVFQQGNFDDADFVDINGDGVKDLALSSRGQQIRLYMNNGSGSFSYAGLINGTASINSFSIKGIDVDGDGDDDLVTGTYGSADPSNPFAGQAEAYIWKNDGGIFSLSQTFEAGPGTRVFDIDGADFDGDADTDLLLGGQIGSGISLLINDGNGNFSPGNRNFENFSVQRTVEVGDIDADGDLDFITNGSGSNLPYGGYIFYNDGQANFTPDNIFPYPDFGNLQWSALGDLDGDGDLDVVNTAFFASNTVLINDGNNNFVEDQTFPSAYAAGSIIADFDQNGSPDLLTSGSGGALYSNYTFGPSTNSPPVASAGEDQIFECVIESASVTLDASGSTDADDDLLTYSWEFNGNVVSTDATLTTTLGGGTHIFTLTVSDGQDSSTDDVTVTVNLDTEAPVIALLGDNPIEVYRFTGYAEPGADVSDNCSEGLTALISGDVDVNLPGNYTITYYAEDAAGNSIEATRTVNVVDDPNVLAHSFLYLADKKIMLDKMGQSEGDMHSNDEIDIKKGQVTFTGNVSATGKIDVAKYVTIVGDVTSGDELQLDKNVTITGTATAYASVSDVSLTQFSFSAGGSDVKVKKNKTESLTPGSYGKIKVEKKGVLKLSSGEYFFEELILKEDVHLQIDLATGPVTMNVVKKVDFNKNSTMSLMPLGDADSRYVTINSMEEMQIDKDSKLLGTFNAPYKKVHLKKGVNLRGSICAEEIDIDKDAVALHHYFGLAQSGSSAMIAAKQHKSITTEELDSNTEAMHEGFALKQNYPNPFNPSTIISFQLADASFVSLKVYDILGKEVATLIESEKGAGFHSVNFDGTNLASGIYIYKLNTNNNVQIKKMLLSK